jgi:iron complex transport system substrate-binding protein
MRGRVGAIAGVALLALAIALLLVRPAPTPSPVAMGPAGLRVISLVPAATEMLYELGAGDLLVAVSSYDTWPPQVESLPRVGALIDPDVERILTLQPDLVVVDPAHAGLIAQLRSAGIDSYTYATGSLDGILGHATDLGTAVGLEANGRRLSAMLAGQLRAVQAEVEGREQPTVLLVFGRRPGAFSELWVNGGVGFLAEIVSVAGGDGLFADLGRPSFRAGLEVLLSAPPDVVIEARADAELEILEREWRALPGFSAVRVVLLDPAVALIPGPRVVDTAARLAEALHPGSDAPSSR